MDSLLMRKALVHMAGAAQEVGLLSEVLEIVNTLAAKAKIGFPLTREEVEFICATYKVVLSDKHNAWRTISTKEQEEQHSGNFAASVAREAYRAYRELREKDMDTTCTHVLHIFQHHLLPSCSGEENIALYTKMLGLINWILTLWPKIEDKKLHVESTLAAYEAAYKEVDKLSAAHPLRLALHFTKTDFYTGVIECPEGAIDLARQALHDAIPELPSLDEESYNKSAEIMRLMEEKLKQWEPTSPNSTDYSEPSSQNSSISPKLASLSLEEEPSYSGGSPSPPPPPVVPHTAGPPVASNEFISLGDWGYEVHEGLVSREIRRRRKEAQGKRSLWG